jgi:ferredoxin-type protein NapH
MRTIRWLSQITFLAVWLYLLTGVVCTALLGPGYAISEPLGVLQLLIAQAATGALHPGVGMTILVGGTLFIIVTLLLGRAFCAWSCPLGTTIDLIDRTLRKLKFKPVLTRRNPVGSSGSIFRNEMNKYAILASALAGSALFRSPVWCSICPIGTLCRGAIAGAELSIGAELLTLPTVGAMSLGEKRFWCRYLCPVGGLLTIISKLNPFLRPKVQPDLRRDCGSCGSICPEGINICREKSFARCTKCFDCYDKCPFGAVRIGLH